MDGKQVKGIMWAVTAAVISGISVFANSLLVKGIDPLVYSTIKNGWVGLVLVIVLVSSYKLQVMGSLIKKHWLALGLIAIIGGSVSFWMFFAGIKIIGGGEGALIHKTLIFWVALMAGPVLKERLNGKMWFAVCLMYLANFTGGVKGFTALGWGHVMVLGATLMWAVENVIAKKALKEIPVNLLIAARMAGGAGILSVILIMTGKSSLVMDLTGEQWVMLSGVAGLLLMYVSTWYRALKLIPVTMTTGILVGATVITTTLEAIWVKKVISWMDLMSSLLIISGIYLTVMAGMDLWRKEKRLRKEAMI